MRFLGYSPDADSMIEGILTSCSAAVPSLRGMKGAPTPVSTGFTILAATCQGAATLVKLDDTTRLFAATGIQIFEAQSPGWTNRSRATSYTASASMRWCFAQFGNVALATNENDTIQASASSVFADISTAPRAGVIETVGQFVIAANTNDGTYGVSPDRWWCSGIADHTIWTPAVSTQCATGRLTSAPGKIVGLRRFGNMAVAYKRRAMFLGAYVGPPNVWDWVQIPGTMGALSNDAIANIGTPENPRHIFMGADDFYMYDGSKPFSVGTNRIKVTVFNQLMQSRYYACQALHDQVNSRVYFFYPVADQAMPDHCVVYNYRTDQWGVDDRTIQAVLDYVTPGITYDNLGTSYSTYADLPNSSYDEAFLGSSQMLPGIFDANGSLKTLTGPTGSSSISTGDIGQDGFVSTLQRVRPRYLTKPTTANMTNSYRMSQGETLTADAAIALSSAGWFDVIRSARFHRLQIEMSGDWEMGYLFPQLVQDGEE